MSEDNELSISLHLPSITVILETTILAGFIFILALPLVGDYGMWLFPIGRDIIFKLAVEFLLILLLLKTAYAYISLPQTSNVKKNWALKHLTLIWHLDFGLWHSKPIAISLLSFWLVMALSTIFSVQQEFSIWGNIYKNQGLMTWTHYILFFFLLIGFLKEKRYWNFLIHIAIFIATLVGIIALWQALQNGFDSRAASTLNNSNYLAAYLVLLLPITFAFFLKNKNLILGFAVTIQLLALLMTQTRGGYLGIAVAFLIFSFLYLGTKKYRKNVPKFLIFNFQFSNKQLATAFILLITGYGLLVTTGLGQGLQQKLPDFTNRFLNYQSIKSGSAPRLEAWQAGWQGMLKKPLLGYGPENFFIAFDEHYSGSQDHGGSLAEEGSLWESWFDKAHNFIFDIGATTGFLGLFAYIAIFASALYLLSRKLSLIKIGLIASLLGYLAQNLLGFDTIVPGIYLIFLLGYAHFITMPNVKSQIPNQAQMTKVQKQKVLTFRFWILFGIWILAFGFFIFSLKLHIGILRANHQLNLAESLARNVGVGQAFSAFEKGLKYDASSVNPNLRRRYAVISLAYYNAVETRCSPNSPGSDPVRLNCENLFADSKKYLTRALELQKENTATEWPRFTRNYIYAAQISHILGDYENSDLYFGKALELSPNRTSINTEWSRLREKRKE